MKVLVTGTAGFIGFHVAGRLMSGGDIVVGLDNLNEYYDVNLKLARLKAHGIDATSLENNRLIKSSLHTNYSFIKLGLEDKRNLEILFKEEQFDVVVNLAAQAGVRYSLTNPQVYIDSNIVGFANILECSRHYLIKHLVYASSSSVYGLNEEMPLSTSQNVDHPISLYAASKKSNELMAHVYSHLFNIPSTGLRFFTAYGPWGRPDMALFIFTRSILEGKPFDLFNYGDMVRDFTYVGDIAEIIARVTDHPPVANVDWNRQQPDPSTSSAPYAIYNIGNHSAVRLLDFVRAIELELGIEAKINMKPLQPGDVPATYADVSPLVSQFNYTPNTPIREGIKHFVSWYKNYYQIQ